MTYHFMEGPRWRRPKIKKPDEELFVRAERDGEQEATGKWTWQSTTDYSFRWWHDMSCQMSFCTKPQGATSTTFPAPAYIKPVSGGESSRLKAVGMVVDSQAWILSCEILSQETMDMITFCAICVLFVFHLGIKRTSQIQWSHNSMSVMHNF